MINTNGHDPYNCEICNPFMNMKEQGEKNMSLTAIQLAGSVIDQKVADRPSATTITRAVNVTKPTTESRKFVTVTMPYESAQYLRDLFNSHVSGSVTYTHFTPIDDALYAAGVQRKQARNTNAKPYGSSGFLSKYAILEPND